MDTDFDTLIRKFDVYFVEKRDIIHKRKEFHEMPLMRGAKSAKGVSARTTLSARVGACERLLKRMKNTTSFALVQSLKTSKSHRQSTSRSRKLKCHSRMTGASVQIDRCVSPAQALMGRQLKTKLPVLPGNLKQTRRRRTATKRILTEGIVQCL